MQELLDLGIMTLLGYMAVFHILGGGALGIGARQLRNARLSGGRRTVPFLMFWGILFGGIPLGMGIALQDWALLAGQGAVLLAAFAISFFFFEPVRDFFGRQHAFMIGFGVLFIAAGGITAWLMLRGNAQTVSQALAYGSLFFLVGSLALAAGLAQWVRGPKLGRKEKVAPEPEPMIPELEVPVEAEPSGPTFVTDAPAAAEPIAESVAEPLAQTAAAVDGISPDVLSSADVAEMRSPVDEPKPPENQG